MVESNTQPESIQKRSSTVEQVGSTQIVKTSSSKDTLDSASHDQPITVEEVVVEESSEPAPKDVQEEFIQPEKKPEQKKPTQLPTVCDNVHPLSIFFQSYFYLCHFMYLLLYPIVFN